MTSTVDPFEEDPEEQLSDSPPERASETCNYAANRAAEMQATYVASGLLGIGVAGCVYSLILSIVVLLFDMPFVGLMEALIAIGFAMLVGSAVGVAISMFSGGIAISLVNAVNRSLGYPLEPGSATMCAGSLAGYIPTSWVLFSRPLGSSFEDYVITAIFGPVLAMILGAGGAAWSSARYSAIELGKLKLERKYRFSISHMLFATTWIAAIFAIANYFGGLEFVVAAGFWMGIQVLMLSTLLLWQRTRKRVSQAAQPVDETNEPIRE